MSSLLSYCAFLGPFRNRNLVTQSIISLAFVLAFLGRSERSSVTHLHTLLLRRFLIISSHNLNPCFMCHNVFSADTLKSLWPVLYWQTVCKVYVFFHWWMTDRIGFHCTVSLCFALLPMNYTNLNILCFFTKHLARNEKPLKQSSAHAGSEELL